MILQFNKLKKSPTTAATSGIAHSELFHVQSPGNLLQQYAESSLPILKSLVSATEQHYALCYESVLHAFAAYAQVFPGEKDTPYRPLGGFLRQSIERAVTALKYRRGYMLPPGADTETCYREQDQWTYAVFVAALLRDSWQLVTQFNIECLDTSCGDFKGWHFLWDGLPLPMNSSYRFKREPNEYLYASINFFIASKLLPKAALQWLYRNPPLFESWLNYLSGVSDSHTIFSQIIESPQQTTTQEKPITVLTAINTNISPRTENQENKTSTASPTNNDESKDNITPASTEITPPAKAVAFDATQFIDWLNQAITTEQLAINTADAAIHRVKEGLFLIMPTVYEEFTKINLLTKQRSARVNDENFIQILNASSLVLPSARKDKLHRYYFGEWRERNVKSGLVIPLAGILNHLENLPINNNYQPEID